MSVLELTSSAKTSGLTFHPQKTGYMVYPKLLPLLGITSPKIWEFGFDNFPNIQILQVTSVSFRIFSILSSGTEANAGRLVPRLIKTYFYFFRYFENLVTI